MPWVRFDDNTSEDPKIDHLSDGAFRLWFNAICFANRNLTDGFVPWPRVPRLAPHYKATHLNQLVDAGVFHKQHDGITIHGYLRYQLSAEEINAQRERERQKKAKQRGAGYRSAGRDNGNGQFMSPPLSPGDNQGDTPRDNNGDSPRESGGESPATHPTPPPYRESSSSEPLIGPAHEDDEDDLRAEAKRRLDLTRQRQDVVNPEAWMREAMRRMRLEGWTPDTTTVEPPDCDTCKDVALAEPCPDCGRNAA